MLSGGGIDYFPQVQSAHVQLDPQEQLQGPMIDDLSLKSTKGFMFCVLMEKEVAVNDRLRFSSIVYGTTM